MSQIKLSDSFKHILDSHVNEHDDNVIIAELSNDSINGYIGIRQLFTALVPLNELDDLLKSDLAMGSKVKSWGPHPIVPEEVAYDSTFWIDAPARQHHGYETITHYWESYNRVVMMPDSGMLMSYGLIPRFSKNGIIFWDDLSRNISNVVTVVPTAQDNGFRSQTKTYIKIKKDYLEDYLSLKNCAAVAVFYEERYSNNEPRFNQILENTRFKEIATQGQKIHYSKLDIPIKDNNQFARFWGRKLILMPKSHPIIVDDDPELIWPDYDRLLTIHEMNELGLFASFYIKDEVLKKFQDKDEFEVNPEYGSIRYEWRWMTPEIHRYGRNHIEVRCYKFYDNLPSDIIRHFHQYAVPKTVAEKDKKENGDNNIGKRAKLLIEAYLRLIENLFDLSNYLGLDINIADISSIRKDEIEYNGWWTLSYLKSLGYIVPANMTFTDFIARLVEINKLFEALKSGTLKKILKELGFTDSDLGELQSLKLLSMLCQVADDAVIDKLNLLEDFNSIYSKWDKTKKLNFLEPIFAINQFRIKGAHLSMEGKDTTKWLEMLSIDKNSIADKWGYAVDRVYDTLTDSLNQISDVLIIAMEE